MATCVQVLFGLLVTTRACLAGCPGPFVTHKGLCIFVSSKKATWCDAQEHCRSIGGELLTGDIALQAFNSKIIDSKFQTEVQEVFWVGITDTEEECGSNKTGWRWTNGSAVTATLPWYSTTEPSHHGAKQDCLCYGDFYGSEAVILDASCADKERFICQQAEISNPTTELFVEIDVFTSSAEDDFAIGACTNNFSEKSKIQCARRCFQAACPAFYFHSERSECIIVLFTNARLSVGSGAGWKKYTRRGSRSNCCV